MKNNIVILLFKLAVLLLLLPAVSCTETLPGQRLVPEDTSDIIVSSEGGEYSVGYAIENFSSDGAVTAICDAEWIASVYCGEYGKVSFIAERNPEKQQREAVLTVSYDRDPEGSFSVRIIQDAAASGPRLVLMSDDTLSVSVPGGKYEISYALLNKEDREGLKAVSQAEWISALTVEEKTISVFVDANISEIPRSASIFIEYPGLKSLEVVVEQAALSSDVLEISILSASTREVEVAAEPSDQNMKYILMVDSKERIDELGSDQKIYLDDLQFFQQYAASYGMTMAETLWVFLKQGSWSGSFGNLSPQSSYYCYGYGMNEKAEYQTVIYKTEFQTESIPHSDCTFALSASATTNTAQVTIDPSESDVPYLAGIIDPDTYFGVYGEFCNESMERFLLDIVAALQKQGYDRQEIASQVAYKGRKVLDFDGLIPGSRNMVYCVGLSEDADMMTDAFNLIFNTQDIELPPLTYTFEVTELKPRSISATIRPSDSESYYCWGITDASYTQEDIINMFREESKIYIELGAVSDFAGYVAMYLKSRGEKSRDFTNLYPEKSYKLYAIQISKTGEFTHPMAFSEVYATPPAVEANCSVRIEYDKFWDGAELAQMYPDFAPYTRYAVLPVQAVTEGDVASFKYAFLSGDWADPSLHSDDEAIKYLYEYGFSFKKNTFFVTWDYSFAIIAVAVDSEGNYSKVYRDSGVLRKEDAADPSEYQF